MHKPTKRVTEVLKLLANHPKGLNLSKISESLKIPASTLSPILHTLQNENFIQMSEKNYNLGLELLKLSKNVKFEQDALGLIKKYMDIIRDKTGQTCQLGILKNQDVLYIEKSSSNNTIQLKSFIGTLYPAYATSLGKALLINKSKDELSKIYPNKLKKITTKTIDNLESLYKQLQSFKLLNYALESGEMNEDIECMGVWIEHNSKIIAAISISYLIFHSNEDFRFKNAMILNEEKQKLEAELKTLYPYLNEL